MDLKKYRQKLIGSEEEQAVSPVIGVILMVAITVILAAVIAAFVLDMGDDMGDNNVNAVVSTEFTNNSTELTVSVTDMGNADGITLVDDSGQPVNQTKYLESTGASETWNVSGGSGYTVQAFTGDPSNLDDTTSIDDDVDSTSVVAEPEK